MRSAVSHSAMAPKSLRTLTLGSRRNTSPGPPSPTLSEATNVSAMHFGANGPSKIITRANLKASIQAYEDLLNTCNAYRVALLAMSKATAAFADAMQRCSGLKGSGYEAGTRLQAASGVHHLMGNLWHVLAESLDKKFEKPLRQHMDSYKSVVNERSQAYERALREKSQVIRDTETRSMNKKERNLQNFREALAVLQRQVDELDDLKLSHYQEIVEHEEEVWNVVQSKICLLLRSSMDVFDRFTAKASDPVIEPMLQSVPDPFDAYGPPQSENQIFSILAPLSISMSTSAPSTSTSPVVATSAGRGSMDVFQSLANNRISSWLPGTNGAVHSPELAEWASASSPTATPPRSTSPGNSTSPPSRGSSPPNGTSRRHTVPTAKKAESKLRSVLAVIDEDKPRVQSSTPPVALPSTSATLSILANSTASHSDSDPHLSWNKIDEDHRPNLEEDETPRNFMLFPSPSALPPSDTPPPFFDPSKQHVNDDSEDCMHSISPFT